MAERTTDPWTTAAIEQNRRWLLAYLVSSTGDTEEAENLVQETFRIAFEKRDSFTPGTNFGAWLRGIAKNCLRRYFEGARRRPILVGEAVALLDKAATEAEATHLDPDWWSRRVRAMSACLERLKAKTKRVIEYRYAQEKDSKQIAELLGVTVPVVNTTMFRARLFLADCVKKRLSI